MYIIGLIFKSYVFYFNKRGILIKYLINLFKSLFFWFIFKVLVLLFYGLLKRKICGVKKKGVLIVYVLIMIFDFCWILNFYCLFYG